MVIRPVAIQHSPPSYERLSRPLRMSGEGATGEGGPLVFDVEGFSESSRGERSRCRYIASGLRDDKDVA